MKAVASKTMAIKARAFNKMRQEVWKVLKSYKGMTVSGYYSEKTPEDINLEAEKKEKLFKEWFNLVREAHQELNEYKAKRKFKKKVQQEREARGYVPKKKTSKEEYRKMQSNGEAPIPYDGYKVYMKRGEIDEAFGY